MTLKSHGREATDTPRAMKCKPPAPAGIAAAIAFYAGARPSPATNEESRDQAAFFGAQQTTDDGNHTPPATIAGAVQ